jgi:hypothetical protein
MTQIERITKEEVQAAKQERDLLFDNGAKLQKDWIEFHLGVLEFRRAVVKGSYKWELCGYRNWTHFAKVLCNKIGESRTVFYEKLKAVESLPPAKIRELGTKSRIFAAKRIAKAGRLTQEVEDKLKKSSADGARRLARKIAKPSEEPRVQLTFNLLETQFDLAVRQMTRIKRVLGFQTQEEAFDFLLGHIAGMEDDQLWRLHNTGTVEAIEDTLGASA